MKALILNSGLGTRMGALAAEQPKCMTEISGHETIISRQLRQLVEVGIDDVVITTGFLEQVLVNYVKSLDLPLNINFVSNPDFRSTNYIYSIYCTRAALDDNILLMHGDLVFENRVLDQVMESARSIMVVSSTLPLPQKDFKAVVVDDRIVKIGIEFFDNALTAQPLYKLRREDWRAWLERIVEYCERDERKCYAENAFNEVSEHCQLYPLDIFNQLCGEIDNPDDLAIMSSRLREVERRTVYVNFATDILHSGHIKLLRRAARFGRLIVGVLSDEVVSTYRRLPLIPFDERKTLFETISGVYKVVEQRTVSLRENLERYRPNYLVHGDDWLTGFQRPLRDEAVSVLASYGGQLIEYPYSRGELYDAIESRRRAEFSLPDLRRSMLRKMLAVKRLINAIEVHNGLTGLLAEQTIVNEECEGRQFDAMWLSSLCDSTAKGKPDIELVDLTSRLRTVEDVMEVTTKPIIFDGDTGGLKEHFAYTVRTLERRGVSMIIIEDKVGLKKNSLFGTEVEQTQDSIENFCEKISVGKKAQKSADFMICARIESLILERGMEDALERARSYVAAGADAIMIHSRRKEPTEIFEFLSKFRAEDEFTPVVLVPTSFNSVTEDEFKARGANVIIYANQLMRASFPAMKAVAESILTHRRALECDEMCMPFKDIIQLIPEDT